MASSPSIGMDRCSRCAGLNNRSLQLTLAGCRFPRNTLGMAVRALHPMDIVLAAGRSERGVHLLHVQAAIRHLRMAGGAGGPRLLAVLCVAGQATDAFVHAEAGAVVARFHLHVGDRARGTDSRTPAAGPGSSSLRARLPACGHGQFGQLEYSAASGGRKARAKDARFLRGSWDGARISAFCNGAPSRCISWQVRHGIDGALSPDPPGSARHGPVRSTGVTSVADAAFEVHAVAAQAIVHQHVLSALCFLSKKDARIGGAVRTGLPGGILLTVAALALLRSSLHATVGEADLLGQVAAQVRVRAARCSNETRRPG